MWELLGCIANREKSIHQRLVVQPGCVNPRMLEVGGTEALRAELVLRRGNALEGT